MGKGDRGPSGPHTAPLGMRFRGPGQATLPRAEFLIKEISPDEVSGRVFIIGKSGPRYRVISGVVHRNGRQGYGAIQVDAKGRRLDDKAYFIPSAMKARLARNRRLNDEELRAQRQRRISDQDEGLRGNNRATGSSGPAGGVYTDDGAKPEEDYGIGDVWRTYADEANSDRDGVHVTNDATDGIYDIEGEENW